VLLSCLEIVNFLVAHLYDNIMDVEWGDHVDTNEDIVMENTTKEVEDKKEEDL
ncbi:hypothetical protein KI387_020635, partial [Taxus chinensis]